MRILSSIIGTALMLSAVQAKAAEVIGNAVRVIPAAFSEVEGGSETLSIGADVVRDAFVRTNKGGSTKLQFKDDSLLEIGSGSRVKLDRFVYADDKTFSNAGVMMLKGSFRWATGHSPKPAYDLRTPTATIGIRGTILDIGVTKDATVIKVVEGAIRACSVESTACIDATPETGAVRVTRTSAEVEKASQPAIKDKPAKKPPAAEPRLQKADAPQAKPKRIRQAKIDPPRIKRRKARVIYIDEPETYYVERPRRAVIDPGFVFDIGFGIIGGGHDRGSGRPRSRPTPQPRPMPTPMPMPNGDGGGDYQ